jgi:hypothetical protein
MRGRGVVLLPLAGSASREVRIVMRGSFPRRQAVDAVAGIVRRVVAEAPDEAPGSDAARPRRNPERE